MKRDFLAVFRKEWKEILPGRAAGGTRLRPLIMVGLMGILVPLQENPQRYFHPLSLIGLIWVPFVAVLAVAPDTFAGERERHTLETLLASRLSDQANSDWKAGSVPQLWLASHDHNRRGWRHYD
jgi:ABC-2 type transport system permease protein